MGNTTACDLVKTAQRFEAAGTRHTLIIACGALAREILAILDANQLSHITLHCLPALLHNRPERIAPAVERLIRANRADYCRILVAYAECGTAGSLDKVVEKYAVERIEGAHCYQFFSGITEFLQRAETQIDAFYLTDFLARQFEAIVVRPLGLDRHPDLKDTYFGNYRTLVYLAQTDDPELDRRARQAADRLGLAYERRFTGYGLLNDFIATQ